MCPASHSIYRSKAANEHFGQLVTNHFGEQSQVSLQCLLMSVLLVIYKSKIDIYMNQGPVFDHRTRHPKFQTAGDLTTLEPQARVRAAKPTSLRVRIRSIGR